MAPLHIAENFGRRRLLSLPPKLGNNSVTEAGRQCNQLDRQKGSDNHRLRPEKLGKLGKLWSIA